MLRVDMMFARWIGGTGEEEVRKYASLIARLRPTYMPLGVHLWATDCTTIGDRREADETPTNHWRSVVGDIPLTPTRFQAAHSRLMPRPAKQAACWSIRHSHRDHEVR